MLQYQQSAVGTICHQKLLGILNCKCNFSYFVLFEFIAIEFILYLPIRAVYPANCRLPRTIGVPTPVNVRQSLADRWCWRVLEEFMRILLVRGERQFSGYTAPIRIYLSHKTAI